MKIKRVGIDFDGTVANFMAGAAPLFAEHYGLTPDLTKGAYSIEEVFGLPKGGAPPDMRDVLYDQLHLFANLPLLEEDIHLLPRRIYLQMAIQHKINTKIYFITARPGTPTIIADSISWAQKHHFYFDDVFFVDDKSSLCQAIGIDVMIDDEPRQVESLLETNTKVVLPDQPWNRDVPDSDNLKRVFNWREALEATKEFMI